jgi:hypothetical protein
MSRFQKATRKKLKLRMALFGPTGAGKTKTALLLAAVLGKRVAVIDSENRSASKYVGEPGVPEFDVCELDSYAPRNYVEAIKDAEREGYDVIIVDGITQAWSGKDGALEMVDKAAKRSQSGNSFTAWRDVTPHHNALVEALVQCKAHLIVTMRAKMEYVLEEDARGKKTPRKVGMAPIQREGMEYELDVVGDLDVEHNLMISKTRCSALDGAVINKPGRELAETLLSWLGEGAPVAAEQPQPKPAQTSREAQTGGGRPLGEERSSTDTTGTQTTSNSAEPVLDDYGLEIPTCPCPVVRPGRPNAGKRWDELPGPLVAKMLDESGHLMTPDQLRWAEYLVTKRQARKAREAAAVAMAAEAGFVPDPAAQAAADGEAAQ